MLQTHRLGSRVVWVKVFAYPHACGTPWGEKEGSHQHLVPQTWICEICLEVPAVLELGTSYLVHGHAALGPCWVSSGRNSVGAVPGQ